MEHDAWFFIGIFVFIFVIWIAVGGPLRAPSVSVPSLPAFSASAESGSLVGGSILQLPRAPYTIGDSAVSASGTRGGNDSGTGSPPPSPGGYSPPSPYTNIVSLSSYVSSASSSDPATEYVQISVAQNATAPVKITGWALESGATYNAELIPKGTRVPGSGVVNPIEDIILSPGERAIIISGESPVGASFRENKCIGYFGNFQQFSPSLPQNCPSPQAELSSFYRPYIHDPNCIDYVDTLPRCNVALAQTATLTNSCQDFLESHFNYNSCVQYHRGDSDFNGDTWRVYLGREDHMWRARHEIVKLLDDRGKTVAQFTY